MTSRQERPDIKTAREFYGRIESMRVYYNYNPSSQQEFMWFEIVFWDIEHIHGVNYRILTPAAKDTITGESQEV